MPKFRKKPVVIDATQFRLGQQPYPEGVEPIVIDIHTGMPLGKYTGAVTDPEGNCAFGIATLERWHVVTDSDWIITGVKGERYPCKSDIFEATYESVDEAQAATNS